MNAASRLAICVLASVVGHYAIVAIVDLLPAEAATRASEPVTIRVVEPPKPPPPPPAPEPEPEPQKLEPIIPPPDPVKPPPPKTPPPKSQPAPENVAPVDTPATTAPTTAETTTRPVFGVTMESTSQGGRGPAVPVGNSTSPKAGSGSATNESPKSVAPPVTAAHEVTKMPLPQGRCAGKYTDEAKAAGVEGVVVLDLVVDETGHTRDITVVQGLEHGLTDAAIAALKACTFTPGEKGGVAVAVKVRGFKIRFVMDAGN